MTYPMMTLKNPKTKGMEWWANVDGQPTRWKMEDGELKRLIRQEDGFSKTVSGESDWIAGDNGETYFWGLDNRNNAVKWVKGSGEEVWVLTKAGLRKQGDGPRDYIPLRKGLIRGDAGMSWQYNRPVSVVLKPRIRNTLILAGVAFVVVMPLALFFGILAGINEGKPLDRFISISSLGATATPEFVTGIFLIIIFGLWLKVLPAVTLFTTSDAIFKNPSMLILPVPSDRVGQEDALQVGSSCRVCPSPSCAARREPSILSEGF
jgi:peptide/nickel transport system permease protein